MQYEKIKKKVLKKLESDLPEDLSFHNVNHTKDVIEAAEAIADKEGVSEEDIMLLKTAALFHDAGMLKRYKYHEEAGCDMARKMLPDYGYNEAQIDKICELIMATKLPNEPKDHLAEILCDADHDYLGRHDFSVQANNLFEELKTYGVVDDERDWKLMQKSFLDSHVYYTETATSMRESIKQSHLDQIIESLNEHQEND